MSLLAKRRSMFPWKGVWQVSVKSAYKTTASFILRTGEMCQCSKVFQRKKTENGCMLVLGARHCHSDSKAMIIYVQSFVIHSSSVTGLSWSHCDAGMDLGADPVNAEAVTQKHTIDGIPVHHSWHHTHTHTLIHT